jgi:hypothetical protein
MDCHMVKRCHILATRISSSMNVSVSVNLLHLTLHVSTALTTLGMKASAGSGLMSCMMERKLPLVLPG